MIKCLSVLFVSFLFLMTGCAPKVITNISKSYPASVTADKVRLYELGEAVPASAERIGNVSVVDNGVSTNVIMIRLFGWRNKKRQKREVTHWR